MKSRQSTSSPKLGKKSSQSTFESARTPNRIDNNQVEGAPIRYFKRTYPIRIYYPNSIEKQARPKQTSSEAYLIGNPEAEDKIWKREKKEANENQVQQTYFCQQKGEHIELKGLRSKNLRIANPITIQIQDVRKRSEVLFQRKMVDENKNEFSQQSRIKKELLLYVQKENNYLEAIKNYEFKILQLQKQISSLKLQNQSKQAQLLNYKNSQKIVYLQLEQIKIALETSQKKYSQLEGLYQEENKKCKESEDQRELLERKVQGLNKELFNLQDELSKLQKQNQSLKGDPTKFYQEQTKCRQRIQSYGRGYEYASSLSIKTDRSVSIQHNGEIQKLKSNIIYQKSNISRFVQTETCKLETALKQNEILLSMNKSKDKVIKNFQKDISLLNTKLKKLKLIEEKNIQNEKLISELNEKIMIEIAAKLCSKYRFY